MNNGSPNLDTNPLFVLPRAIRTMLRVAQVDSKLGVAHRSAENALLYAYLWQAFETSASATSSATDRSPSVIVINDKDHGFRWYSPLELYQWLVAKSRSAYLVWNMASPLADGRLWKEISLYPEVLRRTVLIVDEDQLRHAGVDLGRAGSSERTFQEFWQQLYTPDRGRLPREESILAQLTECKALVICFDGGVLYYSHDGGDEPFANEALRMYSLSPKSPNAWPTHRPERSGEMFGRDLIVAAAIATAIELQSLTESPIDLLTAVDYGCRLSVVLHRGHLDAGYAPPSLNQAMYSALRPQPFSWLFQHWFDKHPLIDTSQLLDSQKSPAASSVIAPALGSAPHKGQISSPFQSVPDVQLEKLQKDHVANLDKALNAIKKNCKFTRLCSYMCKSDRETLETLKLALKRFSTYSRIEEFHAPIVLNGTTPSESNRRPVESFASIDAAAAHIVTHGLANAIETISEKTIVKSEKNIPNWVPRLDSSIPNPQYTWLTPLIRSDIDNYSDISMLVQDYVHDENRKRPLSLAVFGAPGSGKNTTIEALIAATDQSLAKNPCTFNLSQFSHERDLATAFHQVQDLVLTRKGLPPVVFFDEFDCSFDKEDWGWFKFFLAPMQDGEYRSGENTYHIGRAIFIFSGGISRCYSDFETNMTTTDNDTKTRFEKAKGPDFVSRLRGHLDIPSINTGNNDETPNETTKIRRALILRSILERTLPQIIDPINKEACIDSRIIKAMLGVPRFRHEVRSMQAIIEMSHVPKTGRVFSVAELPSEGQLSMHVEAPGKFDEYLRLPV
ncbi:MAG: ATP-binding protein [Planctomycetaceae bacterium]